MNIDLNADAGESFGAFRMGRDLELFDFISTVNVACGFHAGDPLTMQATLELAKQKNVAVGAHPGYHDLVGFGRRILEATPEQVYADTVYQVAALAGFAKLAGINLSHIKAHGALSTRAWTHAPTAEALARATKDFDPSLPLMVLPGTFLESEAQKLHVPMLIEAFPERAYLKDGRLAPRSMVGSSIHDPKEAARRAVQMVKFHRVEAIDGGWFELQPQTLCIHGDNPHAPEIAKEVRAALEAEGITISNAGL